MNEKRFWYTLTIIYLTIITVLTVLDLIDVLDAIYLLRGCLILVIVFKFLSILPMGSHTNTYRKANDDAIKDYQKNTLLKWKTFFVIIIPLCIALFILNSR